MWQRIDLLARVILCNHYYFFNNFPLLQIRLPKRYDDCVGQGYRLLIKA